MRHLSSKKADLHTYFTIMAFDKMKNSLDW